MESAIFSMFIAFGIDIRRIFCTVFNANSEHAISVFLLNSFFELLRPNQSCGVLEIILTGNESLIENSHAVFFFFAKLYRSTHKARIFVGRIVAECLKPPFLELTKQ